MRELVVVAGHYPDRSVAAVESWRAAGVTNVMLLDTGLGTVPDAVANVGPVWQTGAFLAAYRDVAAVAAQEADAFLFTQDTVTVLPGPDGADPVGWFRRRMPYGGIGAVGWQLFPLAWDTPAQTAYVEGWYADDVADVVRAYGSWTRPRVGIVGPTFYTTRRALDLVAERDLLPPIPTGREQAAGTERAWAYAFALAGVPLVGDPFRPDEVPARVTIHPPLRKDWTPASAHLD